MSQAALPEFIQIEPVGQCNLRCTMCPIQFRRDGPPWGPPAFMDYGLYTRLIDGFSTLKELHLQGLGEPTMHPRFFDMIRYAVGKGIRVSINSNFTLMTPDKAERLVASGLDTLHVSIDGASAETYERIRVFAKFKTVLRNMQLLLKARRAAGGALPHIRLVMVGMRQNLAEIPDIVRLAHRLEIGSIFVQHLAHDFKESSLPAHYQPMRDFVNEQTLLTEDPERIERYFNEARSVAQELGIDLRLPHTRVLKHPPETPGRDRCDWPWHGAYISYQGLAMPCCMIATPDRMNFGSFDTDSVAALWNGPGYSQFRDALSSATPPEVCQSCSIYSGTF
jgi:MoaA/NifB/PqqE/SkfB family radical SAM enzyme